MQCNRLRLHLKVTISKLVHQTHYDMWHFNIVNIHMCECIVLGGIDKTASGIKKRYEWHQTKDTSGIKPKSLIIAILLPLAAAAGTPSE